MQGKDDEEIEAEEAEDEEEMLRQLLTQRHNQKCTDGLERRTSGYTLLDCPIRRTQTQL